MPVEPELLEQVAVEWEQRSGRRAAGRRLGRGRPEDRVRHRSPVGGRSHALDGWLPIPPAPYPVEPHPRAFRRLAEVAAARSDLLARGRASPLLIPLLALSAHHRDWIRPPEAWDPPDGDPGPQLGDLIRHLLADYDVPRFFDAAWLEGMTPAGANHQDWFKLVAAGRNLRTARGLPFPLTKRIAHHTLRAPDGLGIAEALRFGQVVALGGDQPLACSLAATRLATDFGEHDFWTSVIRWFLAHPAVDPADHGPIVDFLHHEKFVASVRNPAPRVRGQSREPLLVPPQPHLSMKGRTPAALLRAVHQWHRELNARPIVAHEWTPSQLPPLLVVEGTGAARRVYETTELLGSDELQAEGRAMHHCVAAYDWQCRGGSTSIWSLTVEDAAGQVERLLTLEVRSESRILVQAKGHCNRPPTTDELGIMTRWCLAGGPELSTWLRMRLALA